MDKDPLAAVEWCKGLLSFPPKTGYEGPVFYMNFDREGLLPEWRAVQPGNQYKLLASMLACWGKKDLNAATEWAQAKTKGARWEAASVGMALALSCQNPAEAIKLLEKENIRSSSSVLQSDHLQYMLSNWAMQNRSEAIAYLEKNCPGNDTWGDIRYVQFNAGMDALGYQWAREDLNGALQWTETISNIQEKSVVLGAIVDEWARKDFESAVNYVTALWERQDNEYNCGMLYAIARVWLEKDPQACAAWALQLTDKYDPQKYVAGWGDHYNENILAVIFSEWAEKDHEAAFQLAENLPPGKPRDIAIKAAMDGFVLEVCRNNEFPSIKECAALFDKMCDEINCPKQYRRWAYKAIAGKWAVEKPQETIEWARTNGGHDVDMIMACCCSEKASYPEKMQWVSEMQEKVWREKTTKRILFDWCNKNMDEAKSWAQNSPLSETANKWIQESSLPQAIKDKWLAGK